MFFMGFKKIWGATAAGVWPSEVLEHGHVPIADWVDLSASTPDIVLFRRIAHMNPLIFCTGYLLVLVATDIQYFPLFTICFVLLSNCFLFWFQVSSPYYFRMRT